MTPDERFHQLPQMLAAVKAVDPGFRIMISPDFDTAAGASPQSVVDAVMKVKDDRSVYRLADGRMVLAPFYPERQPLSFWTSLHDQLEAKGVKTALVPIFLSSTSEVKRQWSAAVAGFSSWGSRWASATKDYAQESHDSHQWGKLWMSPVAFEDVRPHEGYFWEPSNSAELRGSFQQAITGNSDWMSLTTWNDYTESWMSPSAQRGYAVVDVSAYYLQWFKTGQAPRVVRDTLFYFHRSQRTDAPYDTSKQSAGPMKIRMGDPASNTVELLAFLTEPGQLSITQGGQIKSMDAPAGVTSFTAELVAGTTPKFALSRNGKQVQQMTSAFPIATQVKLQNFMNHAGSSRACPRL